MAITRLDDMTGSVLGFDPSDLEGVATLHSDVLVIQATIANFDVGRVC